MNEDRRLEPMLRSLEREITAPLSAPPRQAARDYAPPDYRPPGEEIDPVIKGLLTHLPTSGSVWPAADRKQWLELMEGSFRLIFKEKATVTPTFEDPLPLKPPHTTV